MLHQLMSLYSVLHGPAQSPQAQAAKPEKPKPGWALVVALAGPRPGSRICKPEPSPQARAFSACECGIRSL